MHTSEVVRRASTDPLDLASLAGKYMAFKLSDEVYGLEILKVREIIRMMEITRVPRVQEYVRGVINLRGKVIAVADLRSRFGMPRAATTDQSVIIVVQCALGGRELTMGILVDQVLEVLSIEEDQIEPAPPSLGTNGGEFDFVLGVGKTEEHVVLLLDIGRALSARAVGAFEQSARAA